MKVSLNIDSVIEETTVTIDCKEVDDTIKDILEYLKGQKTEFIVGKDGDMQHILKPEDIHYFHTDVDAVVAVTQSGSYKLKENL